MKKIELSKEEKQQAIFEIKKYFSDERDEEIGDLSASLLLDFITDKIGPTFYNHAVKDAYSYMSEKIEDIFGLEKRPR
jgi:uncharacterized protein (DUF2164 family)